MTDTTEVTLDDDIASFSATAAADTPVGKRILARLQRIQKAERPEPVACISPESLADLATKQMVFCHNPLLVAHDDRLIKLYGPELLAYADRMAAARDAAVMECRRETEAKEKARATCKHYESALYFPGIRPHTVQNGNDAIEINPQRVSEIIDRAESAEAKLARVEKLLRELAPYAWVIGGDDEADANGFIPCQVAEGGEFHKPLYDKSAIDELLRQIEGDK